MTNRPVFAIVAVVVSVSSLVGCGSSSGVTDGGAGGKKDGAATDVAGTTGGATGTGGKAGAAGTTGTTGAGGTTGTAGATGTGGSAGASATAIGKACSADADCTSGLTCITAGSKIIFETEGPAHGYCSKMCQVDADCGSGNVGTCVGISSATATPQIGYCFQSCTFGAMAAKCQGRTDVGCLTLDDTTTPTIDVCYPICSQDSDCPVGRKCDVATNFCGDTAPIGDPLGTHCTSNPDTGASSCAGGCLPIGNGGTAVVASFCSMLCVIGTNLNACNWVGAGSALTSGGSHGVCALSSSTAQVGDIGFCSQECDTAANCSDQTDTGLTCDTSLMSTIGHGICSWG